MKHSQVAISRIIMNDMVPFNNHRQRINKIDVADVSKQLKQLNCNNKKNMFVLRNVQYLAAQANRKHQHQVIKQGKTLKIEDFSRIYKNNYKAFPKRMLVKNNSSFKSSPSITRKKGENMQKKANTSGLLSPSLHLQLSNNFSRSMSPRKTQQKERPFMRGQSRAKSCHSSRIYHRGCCEWQDEVISPWDSTEHQQSFKL